MSNLFWLIVEQILSRLKPISQSHTAVPGSMTGVSSTVLSSLLAMVHASVMHRLNTTP